MAERENERIRVIVYRERAKWVGQCLEHDIRAQADSFDDLMTNLDIAIASTRADSLERHGEAFAHVEPAPPHFHSLWEKRTAELLPTVFGTQHRLNLALCA